MSSDRSDSGKSPIDQLLDLAFYAPLGFVMNFKEVLPNLVERGHQQATMAKMFGEFAVKQGSEKAAATVEKVRGTVGAPAAVPQASAEPAPAIPTSVAAAPEPAAPSGPVPAVADLAIPDYESLSASQVVPRLEGLTTAELAGVAAYEAAHRGRKTILNKVAQLQG